MNSETLAIASKQKRVMAFMIDDMIIALLLLVIFYNPLSDIASHLPTVITPESIELFKEEINNFFLKNILLVITLKVLYHTILVWLNGMTLGKYFMKIKVIDFETQQTPSLIKALIRGVLRILSELVFYLGFVLAFFLPLRQTLHDKVTVCGVVNV